MVTLDEDNVHLW